MANTPVTLVEAAPTTKNTPITNIKSLDNWRAFVHQITPVIVTALVSVSIITNDQATLWIPLIFAILDPLLSTINTQDKIRRLLYGVMGMFQSGALLTSILVGHERYLPLAAALVTVLSSFLARFYTPTTTVVPLPGSDPQPNLTALPLPLISTPPISSLESSSFLNQADAALTSALQQKEAEFQDSILDLKKALLIIQENTHVNLDEIPAIHHPPIETSTDAEQSDNELAEAESPEGDPVPTLEVAEEVVTVVEDAN